MVRATCEDTVPHSFAETQQTLLLNNLRSRVVVDGGELRLLEVVLEVVSR